jgi:hypothetical protein
MKPLVLTKENVLATMEGRKTMTRRIIKPLKLHEDYGEPNMDKAWIDHSYDRLGSCCLKVPYGTVDKTTWRHWPKHNVGDEVYVAEGYQITRRLSDHHRANLYEVKYMTDNQIVPIQLTLTEAVKLRNRKYPYRPTSGRFFYKSLARTFGKITEVKAERIKEISPEDAIDEGILVRNSGTEQFPQFEYCGFDDFWTTNPVEAFLREWVCIHSQESLERNDPVFAYRWDLINAN